MYSEHPGDTLCRIVLGCYSNSLKLIKTMRAFVLMQCFNHAAPCLLMLGSRCATLKPRSVILYTVATYRSFKRGIMAVA